MKMAKQPDKKAFVILLGNIMVIPAEYALSWKQRDTTQGLPFPVTVKKTFFCPCNSNVGLGWLGLESEHNSMPLRALDYAALESDCSCQGHGPQGQHL